MNGNGEILWIILGVVGVAGILYAQSAAAGSDTSGDSSSGDPSVGGASGAAAAPVGSSSEGLGESLLQGLGLVKPKGERNNNPGNLRYVASIQWQGQTGSDGSGYAVFDKPENGIRALGHQLATDLARGQNSVALIIGGNLDQGGSFYGYAPPNENNTVAYINDVSQRLGVDPNQPLDSGAIPALAQAMIIHEEGEDAYGIEFIAAWSTAA